MPRKWPRYHYVYLICYPDGTPYYVGKGYYNRVQHLGRNAWTDNVTAKIKSVGCEPLLQVVEQPSEEAALMEEKRLILHYGRRDLGTGILTNMTDGGETGTGRIWTEAQRVHLSLMMTGRRCPDSTKQAVSRALQGNTHLLGHKHSKATIEVITAKSKANWDKLPEEKKLEMAKSARNRLLAMTKEDRSELARSAWKAQGATSEEMSRRSKMRKKLQCT